MAVRPAPADRTPLSETHVTNRRACFRAVHAAYGGFTLGDALICTSFAQSVTIHEVPRKIWMFASLREEAACLGA